MTAPASTGSTKWMDAFHAELLVEVQLLSTNVEALKSDVPKLTADVRASADAIKTAASKAQTDFEAMGHALIDVMKRNVRAERQAAEVGNAKAAGATKTALEAFTKYFWLLAGLGFLNALLLTALLASRLMQGVGS